MFCHICVTAYKLGRIKSSINTATAFVSVVTMILHYHQEMTDRLDMKCIANEYILKKKQDAFATFPL